ncbi:unnamed protein product [Microthlaspi erraticum]|uniref:F-box domain-containing protein n=1 Tax=Microthlaspi erraticum TaxID=1685480 RepID=A0A6D2IT38_9BRAS|nr:unnamed protein product [Microthlaspi erraticum]
MSSLEKKRKINTTKKESEPEPSSQSTPNSSLPDDVLLSCFARVSKLYYPTLSLVSKRFRSLLTSPEFDKARSLLGHTESCLYVCMECYQRSRWYTLCRKPNQTLTCDTSEGKKKKKKKKNKSSGYVLARVPIPCSPRSHFQGLVAVGSNIYNIEEGSSKVSILDCRSHTWGEAPSLPLKLASFSASVLDGNIYVAGGDASDILKNNLEVFDTETQTWDLKTIPYIDHHPHSPMFFNYPGSACIDGKFHVMKTRTEGVAYNSKESRWDLSAPNMGNYMVGDSYCVIENVLYSAMHGVFRWYDSGLREWKRLMGLEGLPNFPFRSCVRLADYGGKLVVLWEGDVFYLRHGGGYNKIWCAEIALERRQREREISGKVEWFDHVLTVESCDLVKVLAVTLS